MAGRLRVDSWYADRTPAFVEITPAGRQPRDCDRFVPVIASLILKAKQSLILSWMEIARLTPMIHDGGQASSRRNAPRNQNVQTS